MTPSSGISRLVATVAAQGSILNPPAPYANCSYHLQFYGPSLSCGSAISTNTTRVAEILSLHDIDTMPFVSFLPMEGSYYNETDAALSGLRYILDGWSHQDQMLSMSSFDLVSEDHGRIYVAINDKFDGKFGKSAYKIIECGLYNMSYNVVFAFSNWQPSLAIANATRLNGVASKAALTMCRYGTAFEEVSVCSPDAMAYIALFDAFGQQLVGHLEESHFGPIWSYQTQVAKTVFMDTKELYGYQYCMDNGKEAGTRPDDAMGMAEALEEVFTNTTLSLFSRKSFLYVLNKWHPFTLSPS